MGKWETDKDVDRLYNKYVKDEVDDDLIKDLKDAGGEDISVSEGRDILVKHVTNLSFIRDVNMARSPELAIIIEGVVSKILKRPEAKLPAKKLPSKTLTQKSRTGRIYKRSKPQRFSIKEITFIKVIKRQNRSNDFMVKSFNKQFTPRSKSSLVSKKNRL